MIAEIDISSASYSNRIVLDEMLFSGESFTEIVTDIPTGNYAIRYCCAYNWVVGIVNGQYVNDYDCNMSDIVHFDIIEKEENTISFN